MNTLELLLRLAKIREDQAMANARRATGQVNQAQGFQRQVLDYAKDYENQIMEGAKTGTSVAFIQDANAFREKLLLSSSEITHQIKGLSVNSAPRGLASWLPKPTSRLAKSLPGQSLPSLRMGIWHALIATLARKMLSKGHPLWRTYVFCKRGTY
jgi:hypothetical protein